jgi:hypothetical protein
MDKSATGGVHSRSCRSYFSANGYAHATNGGIGHGRGASCLARIVAVCLPPYWSFSQRFVISSIRLSLALLETTVKGTRTTAVPINTPMAASRR